MDKKVVLILVDGMRADAVLACGNPFVSELLASSTYSLNARTVMPSVTLPCHMSLFHSVDPDRHGILSNTYVPQVRPIEGLIERLDQAEKQCAFFYTWEQLRDLARPGHLSQATYINLHRQADSDAKITDAAIRFIKADQLDFVFLYLGQTDECGHDSGWMGEAYLNVVSGALDCARRVREEIPAEYDVIITADNGGHGRSHGSEMPEDMTIPLICCGPSFEKGREMDSVSIKDIAPTIVKLLGAAPARVWEGTPLPTAD